MAKYVVTVEEILRRTYIVEAESSLAAEKRLHDAHFDGMVILDGDDYCGDEYTVEGEADEWDLGFYKNLDDIL